MKIEQTLESLTNEQWGGIQFYGQIDVISLVWWQLGKFSLILLIFLRKILNFWIFLTIEK